MRIPHFPEAQHPIVRSLATSSDRDLLADFREHPEQGKYFTALFCRYSPLIYALVRHGARSPVQADYLFALTWRHMYHELRGLDPLLVDDEGENSLQSWLVRTAGFCVSQIELPPPEDINYDLQAASPPLWCHLELAMDRLPPLERFVVLMAQTFHWNDTRIAAYLQAEEEMLSPAEVRAALQDGYRQLEQALPADIRAIYLAQRPLAA
ncbi:RNA polymerase sigma factor [Rubidibacter lacunae]|uniref:RNA polymerase sigma factor n=1 Tax=Rubidibacter lacunae TaxID=582514 RepID=UPI0018DBFA45|nr:sigma-70 family RNA polymerase sigma factor [Rubidibacter lacunae]